MASQFGLSAARLSGGTVKIDKAKHKATVCIPHLCSDFLDRNGAIDPLAVQTLLSRARSMASLTPLEGEDKTFLEFNEIVKDVFTFMASTRTEINPECYGLVNDLEHRKLVVELELGYVGTSSLSSTSEFKDLNTGTVFAKNIIQVVAVSKSTRKPVPIPEWWRKKYSSLAGGDSFRLKIPQMEKPSDCFEYKVIVRWSDTDAYKHTNYKNYVRFCLDAAADAVDKGYFTSLEGDLLNYPLHTMQMSYRAESLPSQELLVSVWEDTKNPFLLHFDISRDGSTIFQSSITFHNLSN